MVDLGFVQQLGVFLDVIGASVMIGGIAYSTFIVIKHGLAHWRGVRIYDGYRKDLARSILLGLEFLVAGDIIRTISTSNVSLYSVATLAGIVLIRAFLGAEFELEITGRWPWQRKLKSKKRRRQKS